MRGSRTGAKAPTLVTRDMIGKMEKGSVIVDVAIDQGGCIETIKATSHDHPTYEVDGVVHYGVPNMPGAVSQTSTFALTNTTIRYALDLADKGVKHVAIDAPIMGSVNPKERAFTNWAGTNNDMVFSEYLIDVGTLPPRGAFYIFLHPKIENTHGGPGRAIAILPAGKPAQKQASLRP